MAIENNIQVVGGDIGVAKRNMKIGDTILFEPQSIFISRIKPPPYYLYKKLIEDPGVVKSVVAGENVAVDNTDPRNPVVSVGIELHKKQTTIALTATQTNGIYSVAASGTGYVMSGDVGDLGVTAAYFNEWALKQITLQGVGQLKGTDVIWQTATTFQYIGTVYSGNFFVAVT